MADPPPFTNRLRERRQARDWSQAELAERSGLSRAAVSAIETARVVPSTAAALALAASLGLPVEELFSLGVPAPTERAWAWPASSEPCRFWCAEVGGRELLYPVERTSLGTLPHDGLATNGRTRLGPDAAPADTLVVAGCDPAVGLLARELALQHGVRLVPLVRSSRRALDLLGRGLVHAAGVHLGDDDEDNAQAVRAELGGGQRLLRFTRWEAGLALAPELGLRSIRSAVRANLRWVGREEGSGARRCMDWILGNRRPSPRGVKRIATDHRGVAETIRSGWAQAGVCIRLVAEESGLDFVSARSEEYDLCFPRALEGDRRLVALQEVVRTRSFRDALSELPGYESSGTGELEVLD